jgi:hypothetical protein
LYVVGIQCGGSTSSFRKQAEFVKDISAKGREVELKFNADPCLRGVLVGIQRCCTEGKRVQDQKQRNVFAFEILNCYANFTYKEGTKCSVENVSACIEDLVARDAGEALEVYKHLDRLLQVDNLCVALQEVEWQNMMDGLVDDLLQSSVKVVQTLEESLQQQKVLQDLQDNVLANQEKMMDLGHKTQEAVDSSHQEMNRSFSSVFNFIQQQRQLIGEMFREFNIITDSISFVLRLLQGEASFMFTLIFVAFMIFVSYEVTIWSYFRPARPWLFVLCGVYFLLETLLSLLYLVPDQSSAIATLPLSSLRYTFFLAGAVVVGVTAVKGWKRKSSRRLLLELSQKVDRLKRRSNLAQINKLSPIQAPHSQEECDASPDVTNNLRILPESTGAVRDWENEDVVLEEVVAAPDNNQKKLDFDDTVEEDVTAEKGETETHGEKEQVTWTARTLRSKSRKVPHVVDHAADSLSTSSHDQKRYNLRRKTLSGTPLH